MMTPNEFHLRMEATRLSEVDQLERASLTAMMNAQATGTDKNGKPLYTKASQMFNAEEAANNIHAKYGDKEPTQADIERQERLQEKERINARYREYMQRKGMNNE